MVLLVAKEKLIAASVAWCHCRGVLSAGACLTHSVWNEQKQRGRFPSPESGSVLPDHLENLFFFPDLQGFQSLLGSKYRVRDS